MYERGVFITGDSIREKGRRLQNTLNYTSSPMERTSLTFSRGWLQKFQKRHNFRSHLSHGESGDADHQGAVEALPYLRRLAAQFSLCDVFNADEFGLYYSTAPTRTIGPGPLKGKKVSKEHLTFLVCCNADGTEYVPPLMVSTAQRSRCFGGNTGEKLVIDYDFGGKGWINTEIFTRWLCRLDAQIGRNAWRRILFFVNNAPAHGRCVNRPTLDHVRVEYLPKNTTSILQPLDLGVIACVKRRYKHRHTQHAVDLADSGEGEKLYNVDIRLAGMWIYDIWENLQSDIIHNCWKHSSIV